MSDEGHDAAREAAIRLLARREHAQRELAAKLRQRGFGEGLAASVTEELAGEGLVSDARFAEQYARARGERGDGPTRIRAELARRGVDEALIEANLPDDRAHWQLQARQAHDKRFGPGPPGNLREKARRARYLMNRGFTGEQVYAVLDEVADGQGYES